MKKTILLTTRFYKPGYLAGGPVRSISGIVDNLSNDFHWRILTSDRDLNSQAPYANVALDKWVVVNNAEVWYSSKGRNLSLEIVNVISKTPHDVLYLNSFFDPLFSILPVLAVNVGCVERKPILVAPRGELSEGALELNRLKKCAYLRLAKLSRLYRGVTWHASSSKEAADIARALGAGVESEGISIAPDIPSAVSSSSRAVRPRGSPLRVCFLGRVARMKNLDYALRALSLVSVPVIFSIFGPKEDNDYWRECELLISALPQHIQVRYGGVVAADEVGDVLAVQDVLFLPSRGENFGHVFVEALSVGLPILTSDRTPWRDLEAMGVGWDLPIGEENLGDYSARIEELSRMDEVAQFAMSRRAAELGLRIQSDAKVVEVNRGMFCKLLT